MQLLFLPLIFFVFALPVGLTLIFNPGLAIDLQKKFYAGINWRIEPISLKKELRNTRIMGLTIIILSLAAAVFAFLNF